MFISGGFEGKFLASQVVGKIQFLVKVGHCVLTGYKLWTISQVLESTPFPGSRAPYSILRAHSAGFSPSLASNLSDLPSASSLLPLPPCLLTPLIRRTM